MNNETLVQLVANHESLLKIKSPRDPQVLAAMRKVDRSIFISQEGLESLPDPSFFSTYDGRLPSHTPLAERPYLNLPIHIGADQTCSQPSLVGLMTDLLEIPLGARVLEIGTGCGYQTAILAEMAGEQGHITSIERIKSLVELATRNLEQHFGSSYQHRVMVIHADGSSGYSAQQPYDRIIFTAGICSKPEQFDFTLLREQMPQGILLYPSMIGPMIKERYQEGMLTERIALGHFGFVNLKNGTGP